MKKILILGAGTAGALIANMLSSKLARDEWAITVVDRATEHVYQPGMLFLPFRLYGYERREDITRPIRDPLPRNARFIQAEVVSIDTAARRVQTSDETLEYDWLVLALGCRLGTGEVDGLPAAMDSGGAHTFYSVDGALRMQQALADLDHGRLVLNIADMPIKCPVAPIEFVFLADYYYQRLGRRDRISITLVTPLSGAFTKPVASEILTDVARRKGIDIVTDFTVERLDAQTNTLHSFEGKSVGYDLLCMIPPNLGPSVLTDAGLADESGYALTDPRTLKSRKDEHVYVIGDNSNVATSKAGSVAHFEAETLVENLLREMDGRKPLASFDGHANCFVETGHHKAMLLDFNYDVEPLPGKFPLPWIGPLSLLQESYLNHWGKILFKWAYWNLLLSGRLSRMPLLTAHMSFLGKDITHAAQVRRAHSTPVKNFMVKKVISIQQGRPLSEAATLLTKYHVSGLPVVDVDERLVGMLTEADFLSALDVHHPRRKKSMGTIVDDLMTSHPITLHAEDTLETTIERMETDRIKQLIVINDERRIQGIITRGDLVRLFAD